MARIGKYREWLTEENLLKIEAWARDGLADIQIAHNIGISQQTFYDWKKKFPEFSEALKKGKEVIDIMVENALLKRALGYDYEETTTEIKKVPYTAKDGTVKEKEEKHVKKVTRIVQPDTVAQIFWLKNRRPDKWRDRQDQIITHIEDLQPLAEMLNEPDANDSMETVFEEA